MVIPRKGMSLTFHVKARISEQMPHDSLRGQNMKRGMESEYLGRLFHMDTYMMC